MVIKQRIDVCCIQETKMENVEAKICCELWSDNNFDWAFCKTGGRSGGILTIWNKSIFCKSSVWHISGLLVVNGY
ncbi:hypothetical protein ACS0TY_006047 [Phlomoides rotata]